jgi:hypothetical protein
MNRRRYRYLREYAFWMCRAKKVDPVQFVLPILRALKRQWNATPRPERDVIIRDDLGAWMDPKKVDAIIETAKRRPRPRVQRVRHRAVVKREAAKRKKTGIVAQYERGLDGLRSLFGLDSSTVSESYLDKISWPRGAFGSPSPMPKKRQHGQGSHRAR